MCPSLYDFYFFFVVVVDAAELLYLEPCML